MLEGKDISGVFRESYPHLCRFLESIVGRGRTDAQDIAQESFLRLCKADLGDISAAEMRFWLYRVARNLALNEISKKKTRQKFGDWVAEIFYRKGSTPEADLERTEDKKRVRELLGRLPEHQRSALILREQEEMNYREIALVLNISESKVKVDIFRGRQALRKMWFETEDLR